MKVEGTIVNKYLNELFSGKMVKSHPAAVDSKWLIADLKEEDDRQWYGSMVAAGVISHHAIIRNDIIVGRTRCFREETGLFCFTVN